MTRAAITDRRLLDELPSSAVAAWLRSTGWSALPLEGRPFAVYERASGEALPFEVAVPNGPHLRDYGRRMAEVLDVLEVVEGRSQLEIVRDIRSSTFDLIRVRVETHDTASGRIAVEHGAALFSRVRDLLLSGACAALEARPLFGGRKPAQAMEYLRQVRFGPTEAGSFVATVESPVAPQLQPSLPGVADEVPFERRAVATLAQALRAARDAAASAGASGAVAPFEQAVAAGVSANLCDAVAGLVGDTDASGLDFGFAWARTRPAPTGLPTRVVFAADAAPILREAARVFRAREPESDFELDGLVVKLDSGDPQAGGVATVFGTVEERARKVRVSLGPEDYQRAVAAHGEAQRVAVEGELAKQPGGLELSSPRRFRVLADD